MAIRERVRRWLGLDEIESAIASIPSTIKKAVLEESDSRYTCAEERHGEVIELLTKLEQHFTSQHVGASPENLPVYDWEQVQIQELAKMLANPPKEED